MKFYDVALAQGVHDKVLAYDFFRFVSGPPVDGENSSGGSPNALASTTWSVSNAAPKRSTHVLT
jgi:hypothetical protein